LVFIVAFELSNLIHRVTTTMSELTLATATEQSITTLSKSKREPDWLRAFRIKSLRFFRELPAELSSLYTKYVDLAGVDLESTSLDLPEPSPAQTYQIMNKLKSDKAFTLFQIDSKMIQAEIPEPLRKEGVIFTDIGTAVGRDPEFFRHQFLEKAILPEDDKFAALNNAVFTTGFFIRVPKGVEIAKPFRIVTILDSEGHGLFAQNLIVADTKSKFTVLEESYSTKSAGKTKRSTYSELSEIYLHEGAEVTYAIVSNMGPNVNIFLNKKSVGERDSKIVWSSGLLGGALTRSRLESLMNGEGASSENVEIVFGTVTQHFDAVSNIAHIGENTSGHTVSRGVVKDKARSVFKGMIRIEKNARNSRAYLAEHGMILGKDARLDAIPGLEIKTNDVKATHSASVAQINDEELFYLMSRGLSEEDARKLVVFGFFEPLLERIPVLEIAKRIRRIIDLKWSGIFDFESSLSTSASEDEYYEEEAHKPSDIFEGHYKYRQ
jgi:FeS assembly protein SufD